MITATVTVVREPTQCTVTVPSKPKRRYSSPSEWIASLTRSTKRRAASHVAFHQAVKSSPACPNEKAEDFLEHDDSAPRQRTNTWQKRLSKRLSVGTWNPEWHIQDAIPVVQDGITGTWQAWRKMSATESSHETNFPPSNEFPAEGGLRVAMPIYGIIDSLDIQGMRLLLAQGMRNGMVMVPDENGGKQRQMKPFELLPSSLRNGDLLCSPPAGPYANDSSMAMVLRGGMQRFELKCRIVGVFPIGIFGEKPPETYEVELMIF